MQMNILNMLNLSNNVKKSMNAAYDIKFQNIIVFISTHEKLYQSKKFVRSVHWIIYV